MSSNAGYTKGPWVREDNLVYSLEHYGWKNGKEIFSNRFSASVQGCGDVPKTELEANARLIAAAPELLEALKNHHQIGLDHEETYPGSEVCLMTEAAISKAEGK